MTGLGTIANVAAVLAGASVGIAIKGGLPKRFEDTIMSAIGLSTFFIGITGALSGMMSASTDGTLNSDHIMLMILSMVIGGLCGEAIDIERRLDQFGGWCKSKFKFQNAGNEKFVEGFVTSALLFCVGAMAIVGSLEDGLNGNATTLYAKSILDGVAAIIFSASLGVGVYFSVIPLAIYQGGITLLAGVIRPLLSDAVISQMSFVGSILIFAIGFNLVFNGKIRIKVGNLLPAMFMPVIFDVIIRLIALFK